jgi:TonB-linked SusC/RagA family outer membrane protein
MRKTPTARLHAGTLLLLSLAFGLPGRAQLLARGHGNPSADKQPVATLNAYRSLKDVLQSFEQKHKANFIYAGNLLDGKFVTVPDRHVRNLDEALTQILGQVDLTHRVIQDKVFVILARKPATDPAKPGPTPGDLRLLTTEEIVLAEAVDRRITGRVTSAADNTGIPGANVQVKGTTRGTTTDAEGNFALSVPDGEVTLIVTSVGYARQEVAVGNRSAVDVSLAVDVQTLGETVVIGYGTVQKKDLIGAVGVAGRKEFGDVNVSQASQLIQGKLAGVQVINNSGLPGSGTNIVVRGTGTFTNAEPLYVIDGIQTGSGEFNAINPNDIEEITVLKDASSVAIYGARGANGVVIVTTRKGKTGAARLTYNGSIGLAQPWKKLDLLNARQYIDFVNDYAATTNTKLPPKLTTPDVLVDRTDWQNEIFRTATVQEHNLGISGGSEKTTYNVSFGYADQEAIMRPYRFKRFNLRASLEEHVGKRLRLGQMINVQYRVTSGNTASFIDALRMPPYSPIYDPDNLGGYARVTTIDDLNDAFNPFTTMFLTERRNRDLNNYGQFWGEFDIYNGLKWRTQASLSFWNYSGFNYTQANRNGNLLNPNGITENYGWSITPLIENILSYDKKWGEHTLTALVGNTYQRGGVYRSLNVTGSEFPNDQIKQIGAAGKNSISGASAGTYALLSYFARLNYGYLGRYLLTASFRRDGVPVFGKSNRFGNFPAVGFAWRVSEEAFMKDLTAISDLKFRASWGRTGNASIPGFLDQVNVFKGLSNNNSVYSLGPNKDYAQGATVNQAASPNLRWEETTQTDIGLDLALLRNRLVLTLDYYNRKNDGLLVYVPIPLSTGVGGPYDLTGRIPLNAASAFNRGFETSLTFQGQRGDLRYSLSGNVSYNKNEVTSLGTEGATPIVSGAVNQISSTTRTDVGQPVGAFYGYVVDRVLSTSAEASGLQATQKDIKAGDFLYKDLNGDGKIDDQDQTYLGSPIPKWQYGANLNLGYRGFDLMVALQGLGGVQLFNGMKYWTQGMTRPFNSETAVLDRWRKEGDVASLPRAGQNSANNFTRPSSFYVENGAYLRVRNVTLGYSLPKTWLGSLTANALGSARLYVTAQNLFTFTKYSGYDPEVSAQGDFLFQRGIDNGQYPQPRTFLLGLQLGF